MKGKSLIFSAMAAVIITSSMCSVGCFQKNGDENIPKGKFDYAAYGVDVEESMQLSWNTVSESSKLTFASSDESIVTIDETGMITGKQKGTATITATEYKSETDTHTFTCTVEINDGIYSALNGEETFIKWEGRNFIYNNVVNCFNSASGFETLFYGTSFSAEIVAGSAGSEVKLAVMVDDLHTPTDNNITLSPTRTPTNYVLAENLEEGYHRIRVYKLTEAMQSSVAFKSMKTDGYFWARPNDKKYKIEIYGDSITVGYNNMREEMAESPSPQNSCMTYGWLAAQQIDADVNIIARTGIGMSSSNGANFYMKNAYKLTYCAETEFLGYNKRNPKWDFTKYIPDVVVINVGTNDGWGGVLARDYIRLMREMTQDLIDKYGSNTKILYCGGVITSAFMTELLDLADEFPNAQVMMLPSVGLHPNAAQHQEIADSLADKLNTILSK